MDHLSEQDLAEWERFSSERKAEIREHVAMCEGCSVLLVSHLRLLELLDESGAPEMRDQTDRVMALMMKQRVLGRRDRLVLMKMAAAIVLSSGVGYFAGLFSRPAVIPTKADPQQAANMLYLDELGFSATGDIRKLFLSERLSSQEETQG